MYTKQQIESLPKIEVSFQDDFSGSEKEIVLTPDYILRELRKIKTQININDKILLWEKDLDDKNNEYYLCNIGQIIKVDSDKIKSDYNLNIPIVKLTYLNGIVVIIYIDKNNFFNLSNI